MQRRIIQVLIIACFPLGIIAQKDTAFNKKPFQYPKLLERANFGVDVALFQYAFSAAQLEPGFKVESVTTPPLGVA
ncbi:MAG: hypothetical protein K2X48_09420 [Chitinophagaceae bacterium]|nr:hypothetical protein [Chitinophagaceae bacterium]